MIGGNFPALIIIIIGCVIAAIVYIAGIWFRKKNYDTNEGIIRIAFLAIGIPAVLSIIAVSVFLALRYVAEMHETILDILDSPYARVVYVIIGSIILALFVKNFLHLYSTRIAARTTSSFDDKLVHFLQSVYGYVILIGAFFAILSVLKIDIAPFLATGGLIGIIIGLAAQDTFGNFFSGAMIAADQPFREGDRIEIQGVIGDVVSVGPRSTRLRTLDSQLVTVPNKLMTENMLTNFALPEITQKVRISVGVAYSSEIEKVRSVLMQVAMQGVRDKFVIANPAPMVYFLEYGPSALMFQLLVWTDRYDQTLEVKDYLNTQVHESFRYAGIEIPYPQMVVHMQNSPPHI